MTSHETSKTWPCQQCKLYFHRPSPVPQPARCPKCGSSDLKVVDLNRRG